MRRALIPWLLLGLALMAIVVPMAQGTSSAKDPRVAGLIKKVNVLQKQVAALIVKSNCIAAQGVVLRGTPASQDGYVYKRAADPSPQVALHDARRTRDRRDALGALRQG